MKFSIFNKLNEFYEHLLDPIIIILFSICLIIIFLSLIHLLKCSVIWWKKINFKNIIIFISIFLQLIAIYIWIKFDPFLIVNEYNHGFQFFFNFLTNNCLNVQLTFAIDGFALIFIELIIFIFSLYLFAASNIEKYTNAFFFNMSLMKVILIIVFSSLNLFIFYIFVEVNWFLLISKVIDQNLFPYFKNVSFDQNYWVFVFWLGKYIKAKNVQWYLRNLNVVNNKIKAFYWELLSSKFNGKNKKNLGKKNIISLIFFCIRYHIFIGFAYRFIENFYFFIHILINKKKKNETLFKKLQNIRLDILFQNWALQRIEYLQLKKHNLIEFFWDAWETSFKECLVNYLNVRLHFVFKKYMNIETTLFIDAKKYGIKIGESDDFQNNTSFKFYCFFFIFIFYSMICSMVLFIFFYIYPCLKLLIYNFVVKDNYKGEFFITAGIFTIISALRSIKNTGKTLTTNTYTQTMPVYKRKSLKTELYDPLKTHTFIEVDTPTFEGQCGDGDILLNRIVHNKDAKIRTFVGLTTSKKIKNNEKTTLITKNRNNIYTNKKETKPQYFAGASAVSISDDANFQFKENTKINKDVKKMLSKQIHALLKKNIQNSEISAYSDFVKKNKNNTVVNKKEKIVSIHNLEIDLVIIGNNKTHIAPDRDYSIPHNVLINLEIKTCKPLNVTKPMKFSAKLQEKYFKRRENDNFYFLKYALKNQHILYNGRTLAEIAPTEYSFLKNTKQVVPNEAITFGNRRFRKNKIKTITEKYNIENIRTQKKFDLKQYNLKNQTITLNGKTKKFTFFSQKYDNNNPFQNKNGIGDNDDNENDLL